MLAWFGQGLSTNAMENIFKRGERNTYSNEEKLKLGEFVAKFKEEYDAEVKKNWKTKYDAKRKRHIPIKPSTGYVDKAVRSFYVNLVDASNEDLQFEKAAKLVSRSYNDLERLRDPSSCPPKTSTGAGRKVNAPEVRIALFHWLADIRESLKGRLPLRLFTLKAQQLYAEWLTQNPVTEDQILKFSNKWIKSWEKEYGLSVRKPNKRYSIKKEDLFIRLRDYLQNVWAVRRYFIEKYGVDPPIINGDQMPLHKNESSQEKTLAFKGEDTFIKENHKLSREQVTVFTQVASVNDTDLHRRLKALYRHEEMDLMLKMLEIDKNKVPSPKREDMVQMLLPVWQNVPKNSPDVFKKLFGTNALDASEDHLVSDKLFVLIGNDMQKVNM